MYQLAYISVALLPGAELRMKLGCYKRLHIKLPASLHVPYKNNEIK